MNTNASVGGGCMNELSFELKYCERCGGLWLRPMGGAQIYCVGCGRAMAELPPGSKDRKRARVPGGPRSRAKHYEGNAWDEGIDAESAGGVA
jgi:hypothetical protein